ncbi:6-phosphogluconolactonase [Auritidibacter sp. NML100628]|uniref:6-phosphogluconolactonase n=1 Tax=Auritidibacter sp. NML100628 TaxID=2170742 RepID=UPI001314B586|nr:6-phosphogluconolactonase [Auritidibacter sp. NML100628]
MPDNDTPTASHHGGLARAMRRESTGTGATVAVFPDKAQLLEAAAVELVAVINRALDQRGRAQIVLTGGTSGIGLLERLADPKKNLLGQVTDWSGVQLWFGDERYLDATDAQRNARQASDALVGTLVASYGLGREQFHPMAAATVGHADRDHHDVLATSAEQYATELATAAERDPGVDQRLPRFDVVLLGVGEDGHVASLFPGLPGVTITGRTVIPVTGSPKPPPERLSLSLEALNSGDNVWLFAPGAGKAGPVGAVRSADTPPAASGQQRAMDEVLPALVVRGRVETLWWVDEQALSEG